MVDFLSILRDRLMAGAYVNEAAVSHGIVTPLLNLLGWDSSDPEQIVPEYNSGRGRVDFALMGRGRKPTVFIEVKGIGRVTDGDGDRQLFEYAFHEGVPMCVLTDGGEWSFYLPGAQGSYEDRRVYRLLLQERDSNECESVLQRYLSRERVRNGQAYEDAQHDYRNVAGRREAAAALPKAWSELITEPEDLLLDLLAERAEAYCGFRPDPTDVQSFLQGLRSAIEPAGSGHTRRSLKPQLSVETAFSADEGQRALVRTEEPRVGREVRFGILGTDHVAANASEAFLEILHIVSKRDPARLPAFARKAEARTRKHIGRLKSEIYPDRPDLRVSEFHPGWFVGLNIANREKMRLIRYACDVWGLTIPGDVTITLPNAS